MIVQDLQEHGIENLSFGSSENPDDCYDAWFSDIQKISQTRS